MTADGRLAPGAGRRRRACVGPVLRLRWGRLVEALGGQATVARTSTEAVKPSLDLRRRLS